MTIPFEADVIEPAPAGLAVLDAAIVGVAMMDEAEAREYIKMMGWDLEAADSALTNFRARALDLAEREGWRALGYGGAIEALQTELGAQHSKSYLSRILQAGEIERVLELPIGQLPERTLRPLSQLDTAEQQRAAYQAATTNGKPTAKKMQSAVDQIKSPLSDLPPIEIVQNEERRAKIVALIGEARHAGERTGTRLYQQAYDHAAEITDLDLHNKMIALIDRATDDQQASPAPAASDTIAVTIAAPRVDSTLIDLDTNRMPDALQAAGYYWASANPYTIAQNGSDWRGDAPTIELAIVAAQLHKAANGAPRSITLALTPMECQALCREAKAFESSGLTKRLPTIGRALILLIEAL